MIGRRIAVPACLLAAVLTARAAHAADPAAAQGLFAEGKRLMATGHYAIACTKFEESQKLDPAMGTQFHLANCYEKIGRVASAWANFLEVAAAARVAGHAARERVARRRASTLEPALSKIVVIAREVQDVAGLTVTRDGAVVGRGQWGSAVPVDPGPHTVTASAPGMKSWETTVRVPPEGKQVAVEVPRLAPALQPSGSHAPASAPEPSEKGSVQRALGLVVGGIGLVGLGVGSYYGIQSKDKRDEAGSHCIASRCDPSGLTLREDALGAGNVSTAAFGVGGAVIVAGLVIFFTAPRAPASTREAHHPAPVVTPWIGKGLSGLAMGSTF